MDSFSRACLVDFTRSAGSSNRENQVLAIRVLRIDKERAKNARLFRDGEKILQWSTFVAHLEKSFNVFYVQDYRVEWETKCVDEWKKKMKLWCLTASFSSSFFVF